MRLRTEPDAGGRDRGPGKWEEEGERPMGPRKWLYLYGGKRLFLGIEMYDLGEASQLARFFGVKKGVLVTGVVKDSPAEKAGLRAGDVILSWNGDEVNGPEDLTEDLEKAQKGETVVLGVMRQGDELHLKVRLTVERKEAGPQAFGFALPGDEEELKAFRVPPMPDLPRAFRYDLQREGGASMKRLEQSLKQYREELEKIREELRALRKELKGRKGGK